MARRRYGEVTSGSGKSHQGRRITMAQPVSSILGDVVKSSRSIAHSDDFEGHKLIQTNSRQLILLDLNILYWCPASRDQIKSLLVQPQISCNASGLAVANPIGRAMIWDDIRIWGSLVFRNQIYGWRDVHQCRGQLSRSLLSCPPRNYELEKTFIPLRAESVAGFAGAPSTPSVVSVPFCAVLPSAPSCEMVRDGVDGEHSDTTALCDRNVSFQPARNIPSLCCCLPPVPPVSAKQGDRDCYFLFRQNVCTSSSSSSKEQQGAATTGKQ